MFVNINGIDVEILNFSESNYNTVESALKSSLSLPKAKNRDVIYQAFKLAVSLAPQANASDLWHHVVYRIYMEQLKATKPYKDPGQSWKRASGDAFELFLADYYNTMFKNNGLRLIPLTRDESKKAFNLMGISGKVGDSKLDIAIIKDYNGKSLKINNGTLIGGIHVKASLAERVSDDVPASTEMMKHGYLSYLFTLDVKSFPLSETVTETRAYINKGELGTPDAPTDKRKYIEEHGSFNACFSLNKRTVPSPAETYSRKMIYTVQPNGKPDKFFEIITKETK